MPITLAFIRQNQKPLQHRLQGLFVEVGGHVFPRLSLRHGLSLHPKIWELSVL